MSKFKGTKGLWTISFMGNILDESGKEIVNPEDSRRREEENAANAKLISAAPEMLSLLENIVEYWNGDRNDKAMFDALNHIIYESEEMIKKATELQ